MVKKKRGKRQGDEVAEVMRELEEASRKAGEERKKSWKRPKRKFVNPAGSFPYIVVRYMAAVYSPFRVEFAESGKEGQDRGIFRVICPNPRDGETLTQEAREAVVRALTDFVVMTHWRSCAVFGEEDCIYVEPDGSANPYEIPPRGGLGC